MVWIWILVPLTAITLLLAPALVIPLAAGRRKFLLDMKREEARIAEARVKELELQQKRAELEYREALLELERFDREAGGRLDREAGGRLPGEDPTGDAPPELDEPR